VRSGGTVTRNATTPAAKMNAVRAVFTRRDAEAASA
jgi:hypothetical protein